MTKPLAKIALALTLIITMLGTTMAQADAQNPSGTLTLELDLSLLPDGPIPVDGLAYNSFLTISSIELDDDSTLNSDSDPFENGSISFGLNSFRFDTDRVVVTKISYDVINNSQSTSLASVVGFGGLSLQEHPVGRSSHVVENIGSIRLIDFVGPGPDNVLGNIVIEFAAPNPDEDSDGDGVQDQSDNCTVVFNPRQFDSDQDGLTSTTTTSPTSSTLVCFETRSVLRAASP